MDVDRAVRSVLAWLRRTKGVVVRTDWLTACVEWIANEEGTDVSHSALQELVYQQWLHSDLRDTVDTGSLPSPLVTQPGSVHITGSHIVQMDSVLNVGAPAYAQWQHIEGKELDDVPDNEQTDKKSSDAKPTRMLLLNITDGITDCQAMEYQPIPQLSVDTVPGTKLILQGAINGRFRTLLLAGSNVNVLGGSVEELVTEYTQSRLLAKALNKTSPATGPSSSASIITTSTHTSITSTATTTPSASRLAAPISSNAASIPMPSGRTTSSSERTASIPSSSRRTVSSHSVSSARTGTAVQPSTHDDDDFELDLIRESDIADLGRFSESDEEGTVQDTRPGDNISEEMDDQFENDDYIDGDMLLELAAMEDEGEEEEDDISQLTQVVGNHNLAAGPSTDRPMCDTSIVKQEAEYLSSANNATPLQRASVVGKADFWLNHQGFAYVKGTILKIVDKLHYDFGEWSVKAELSDGRSSTTVVLGNRLLERLIGFSAIQFKRDFEPNKSDPAVRKRGVKGFRQCENALFNMSKSVMELTWDNNFKMPCVQSMWDM